VSEGTTPHSESVSKAGEWRLIAELVVRQWMSERRSGTEDERREGEAQIIRARRGARMILGLPSESTLIASGDPQTVLAPPPTDRMASPSQSKKPRVPRPRLAKAVEREWKSPEGQRLLLGATMRSLAQHFGLDSHTSLYDVPLFNEKIRPLRGKARTAQSAGAWVERNARDRHR